MKDKIKNMLIDLLIDVVAIGFLMFLMCAESIVDIVLKHFGL